MDIPSQLRKILFAKKYFNVVLAPTGASYSAHRTLFHSTQCCIVRTVILNLYFCIKAIETQLTQLNTTHATQATCQSISTFLFVMRTLIVWNTSNDDDFYKAYFLFHKFLLRDECWYPGWSSPQILLVQGFIWWTNQFCFPLQYILSNIIFEKIRKK